MIDQKIENVVRGVFELDENKSLEEVAPGSIPQWDSLGHVSLINAIEKAFKIQFTPDEVAEIESLESLTTLVTKYVS